jgi:hypothetical protein
VTPTDLDGPRPVEVKGWAKTLSEGTLGLIEALLYYKIITLLRPLLAIQSSHGPHARLDYVRTGSIA